MSIPQKRRGPILVAFANPKRVVTKCALRSHWVRFVAASKQTAASKRGQPDLGSRQTSSPAETTDMHARSTLHGLEL
jgi:hypothetical protein